MAEEKLQHSSGTLAIDLGSTTTVVAFQAGVGGDPIRLELPPITHRPGEVPSLLWMSSEQPLVGRQVLAVVNFPPRQIGKVMSEVLVLGVPDADGEVVLIGPGQDVPLGGRLY